MNSNRCFSGEESKVRRRGSAIRATQPPHGQRGLELSYSRCITSVLPASLGPSPCYSEAHPARAGAWLELGVVVDAGQGRQSDDGGQSSGPGVRQT